MDWHISDQGSVGHLGYLESRCALGGERDIGDYSQQLCSGYIVEGWVKRLQASLLLGSPDLIEHQYTEIHYEISEPNKIDKLVKSRISMAKKKAPPNHKIGEARKS